MYRIDDDYTLNIASTRDDLEELYQLVLRAAKQSPYHDQPFVEETLKLNLQSFMTGNDTSRVMIMLRFQGTLVGVLIGIITNQHFFFHASMCAFELLWFVDEEHRKVKPSNAMREAYEYWAKMNGCTKVTMGDFGGSLANLYKRKGYRPLETVYVKEI